MTEIFKSQVSSAVRAPLQDIALPVRWKDCTFNGIALSHLYV